MSSVHTAPRLVSKWRSSVCIIEGVESRAVDQGKCRTVVEWTGQVEVMTLLRCSTQGVSTWRVQWWIDVCGEPLAVLVSAIAM